MTVPPYTPILSLHNLRKEYSVGRKKLTAVHDMDLTIFQGETLGLVGESGCGKSTVGKLILNLIEPTRGHIFYRYQDLTLFSRKGLFPFRRKLQMIFQDPFGSLNPRMTIEQIISEPLEIHRLKFGAEKRQRVAELLRIVGLRAEHMTRYPHEFSGGQRQRIGIARALAVEPEFIVCDEAISALDVSVQAQVVNLLKSLQKEMGLTYLFIAHDLAMVEYISDRVAVMYLGQLMELASSRDLFAKPLHPYTQALMSAIPTPDPRQEKERSPPPLMGETPDLSSHPTGCPFHTRCPLATQKCRAERPQWEEAYPGHFVACHYAEKNPAPL